MQAVLFVTVRLVDRSVAVMQVTVSVAIMQLEVSTALMQKTVSTANMWEQLKESLFSRYAYKRWGHLGFLERGNLRKGWGEWSRKTGV